MAFHKLREKVPTARRVDRRALGPVPRPTPPDCGRGLAKGKYDAYLLMPRGVRDEEFHNAITDLLSDWGSTVADPEVVSVKIISPVRDRLTLAIRDFLDRMGDAEPGVRARQRGRPLRPRPVRRRAGYPLVYALNRPADRGALGARRRDQRVRRADRARPRRRGRRGGRRRRAGRPRGRGVRRVRGALDGGPRGRGGRRTGRHQLDDPQLPRLPARHLRHAARAARPQPGDPVRHPVLHRPGGRRAAAGLRRGPARAVHRRAATCARGRS